MKTLGTDNLVARLLSRLASVVYRHPRWFIWPQAALFFVCVFVTVRFLQFDADRDNLVGANKKYHQTYMAYKKEFPLEDDIVVVVESGDSEKNRQFIERLGSKLDGQTVEWRFDITNAQGRLVEVTLTTNLFVDVMYRQDLRMLGRKALQFVPESDLAELARTLKDYKPFIKQFTRATNLVLFVDLVNTQFRRAGRTQSAETDSLIKALPVLERIFKQAEDSLRRPGVPPSPGVGALFGAEDEGDQYISFLRGRIYLLSAHAPRGDLNNEAVERMRRLVEQTRSEVPGVNAGLTGSPVLEHDEMAQSQKDGIIASIVSLMMTALIFIYGYRETGRPVKATICLVVGLGYTLAFATLTVGHLNILTITFLPMLIGLAIDYGVHLVTRYEEELRHGRTEEEALNKAMICTGQGIFTGSFTTAGGFLAMSFTSFKGIQEMGIICGGGLLVCLIPMMTALPALLLRGRQNVLDHQLADQLDARARIERVWLQRPVLVTVVVVAVTAVAVMQWRNVYFDYNLLNMQSKGLPAVEYEHKLINSTPQSVLFGVVIADSLDEAVALKKKLKTLPVVSEVESIADYLQADQTAKLGVIHGVKEELADVVCAEPDEKPANLQELSRSLYSLYGYLGAALAEIKDQEPELREQLLSLRKSIENLRREMFRSPAEDADLRATKLGAFQRALFNDVRDTFDNMRNQDDRNPLQASDLPPALRDRFVGIHGTYLLQVYPRDDLWQRQNQETFINELRNALDPKDTGKPVFTGTPIQLYEYTNLLVRSYVEAAWYSLGAIVLLVFIHFRNVSSVFLALLPVGVGCVWLGGIMGYFDIPLNPANIMTLPLVIGIGVTNGIHILNRFAEENQPGILAKSTGKAVLVSGLTTIAGFGSLILAKHQGIRSLGFVMAIGVAACMFSALTFLPSLLNLIKTRGQKNQPSVENAQSTLGREEPR